MIFYQTNFIFGCVCVMVFYLMGKQEAKAGLRDNSMLWAGLSTAVSGIVIGVMDGGWVLVLLANAGLFVAIALFRAAMDRK